MKTIKLSSFMPILICLQLTLTLGIGSSYTSAPNNAEIEFDAIDSYVAEQVQATGIPGLALGIVQDGQVAHLQGFGVADSSGREVTPQTPFRIGSLTKSFTALAVMQLVEEGAIDLDAPVQTYLPWFELADPEASSNITVRHLLNQTSGFSTKVGNSFWPSQEVLEATIRSLGWVKLTQPVGSAYQYSNLNYMIAGLIVEVASGQHYSEYVTEHIFKPLDMSHSHASIEPAMADGLAQGHAFMFGRPWQNDGPMPPANLPAGTLVASVEDMTHYAIAQMGGGRYGERSILSPQGVAEMHAPAVPAEGAHYGMGWQVGEVEGRTAIWHTGDDGRFHATMFLIPEWGTGVIVLANASGFAEVPLVDQLTLGIVHMLEGQPPAPVSRPFIAVILYWLLLLTPVLQLASILWILRRRERLTTRGVALAVGAYLGVTLVHYSLDLQIITLPSMLVYHPEIGYALVLIAVLGIGWSVILTVMHLRKRISKKELQNVSGAAG